MSPEASAITPHVVFPFLWYEVELVVDDRAAFRTLEPLWVVPQQSVEVRARLRIDVVSEATGTEAPRYTVLENGDRLATGLTLGRLLRSLYSRLHMRAAEIGSRTGRVRLHAATVDIGDQRVILVGASGAGKTTTALTMATQGCRFVGDECVLVNGRTAIAVPRFAHVKAGSERFLPSLASTIGASPRLDPDDGEADSGVVLVDPRKLGSPWRNDERPIDQVVYLKGFGPEEASLLATDEALPLLFYQVLRVLEQRQLIFRTMATLLRRPTLALRVPSAERVLPMITAQLRSEI